MTYLTAQQIMFLHARLVAETGGSHGVCDLAFLLSAVGRPQASTEKIFFGRISKKLPLEIQRTARRKLIYLDDAEDLQDLKAPPGSRLEKLKGDRAGQYSIRINDQWRICFEWTENKAKNVEIVDYHS